MVSTNSNFFYNLLDFVWPFPGPIDQQSDIILGQPNSYFSLIAEKISHILDINS